ncbi:MAG: hypothetical protein ACK5L3_07075 [Oscillospiraceae bacterium]
MKKLLAVVFSLMLVVALAACGSSTKADGVYTAQVDAAYAEANHGWTDTLSVTYKDGVIVEATFESYDASGAKKSEASAETYPMTPSPSEWIPQLSENIVTAGTADKIDGIAGATHASDNAKTLLAAIETEGKVGETITVTVESAE